MVLALALVAAVWFYRRSTPPASSTPKKPTPSTNSKTANNDPSSTLPDVWEERRRKGIQLSSASASADSYQRSYYSAGEEKPFGSSYYYAHNNPTSKGGYSDGLRMEDYTMNQPRLLSRGGKQVQEGGGSCADSDVRRHDVNSNNNNGASQEAANPEQSESNAKGDKRKKVETSAIKPTKRVLPISRYLWDDPGDSTGMATLRIDVLPGKSNTDAPVPWQKIAILDVSAMLSEGGLVVTVETKNNDVDYELRIATLYGAVDKVTVKPTSKRLLVKLYKKKGIIDRSNLKAWPHPHKKKKIG